MTAMAFPSALGPADNGRQEGKDSPVGTRAAALAAAPATSVPARVSPIPAGIPPHASAVVVVDIDALRTNYRALRVIAGRAECAGVVKADAYGLGLERVVRALLVEGCRVFFVANIDEAWRTRQVAPDAVVYVLNGLYPGIGPAFSHLKVQPVLGSVAEVNEWVAYGGSIGHPLPAAIHVDTGMNRLGLTLPEIQDLSARGQFDGIDIGLVMSHLACADNAAAAANIFQRQQFETVRQHFPQTSASLANSAGMFLGPAFHYDLIRPGIAVYGGQALTGVANPMKAVVRVLARIVQVRTVGPGESVGYGHAFRAMRPSRIAIVAAGYADGIPRAAGGEPGHARGTAAAAPAAHIGGHAAPLAGRISMDLTALDVTDVPPGIAERGAFAELIGWHTRVDDLAAHAGTIGYEVLTQLSRRAHRIYLGG